MATETVERSVTQHLRTVGTTNGDAQRQKAGGLAALYLALALLAAIPYFLLVVDYQGASTAAEKVSLVVANYPSMYAMYLATYVLFGIALGVLALALWARLQADAPFTMRIATAIGLLWSVALVTSGMVFTYGMTTINALAATDRAQAVLTWQAVEPVALGLGGAGGEILGGLWVLLVSLVVLRGGALPKALGWLGVVIGAVGLTSVVPPLHDAGIAFGVLEIAWFVWLGILLTKSGVATEAPKMPPPWFVHLFWRVHRKLYRLSGGRFLWTPASKRGWGALRLTTIGRKSGEERSVIVGYLEDGSNLVTVAMNGWDEGHPAWWLNLEAYPDAVVRLAHQDPRPVRARAAVGEERDRLWDRWAAVDPDHDAYAATRFTETPVVVLEPRLPN